MQRVELDVEKHVREGEKDKKNQQAVLVCHALVMTLYYPFENNFIITSHYFFHKK